MRPQALTELPPLVPLFFAGIPERNFRGRRGLETKHNNNIPRGYYLTSEESEAIVRYCREQSAAHPEKGYRTLCWEMVDKNRAIVGESSVYNVMNRHKLTKKREEIVEAAK